MKIALLSDTHGYHSDIQIPKVDILIHCGDFTNTGKPHEIASFNSWITLLKARETIKQAILVPGNHDLSLERFPKESKEDLSSIDHILVNDGIETEGLKIWGCPYTPTFFNWAFMKDEEELYWIYNRIPVNLDILACHGPPRGHCDQNGRREHCGSVALREVLEYKQPRYFICGHIHEGRGVSKLGKTKIFNVANMDSNYKPLPPVILQV